MTSTHSNESIHSTSFSMDLNEKMANIFTKSQKDFDIILDTFENQLFSGDKYQVGDFIDRGENGSVYKVKQLQKQCGRSLVVKIQEHSEAFETEVRALVELQEKKGLKQSNDLGSIAEIVDWGYMILVDTKASGN